MMTFCRRSYVARPEPFFFLVRRIENGATYYMDHLSDTQGGSRTRFGLAVAMVIVLTLITIGTVAMRRYESYLSGYWVGEPSFLQKAGLKDMQLFVAPPSGGCRQGYLIMTNLSGGFIANQPIELHEHSALQRWWTALGSVFGTERDAYKADRLEIEYAGTPAGEESPMPANLKMSVSLLNATMTLYSDSRVYAFLQKDMRVSEVAVESYEA